MGIFLGLIICVVAVRAVNPKCHHPEGRSPFIIGHQGGTGLHRRSSIDAYQSTADSGAADFLECDIASSSDHILLCAHSPDFHRVADPKRFKNWFEQALPKSKQNFQPIINNLNDQNDSPYSDYSVHDWLLPDYTWRLIELLSAQCPKKNPSCDGIGPERLARVDELIEIAYEKSRLGKPIGLYLEIKHQMWTKSRRAIDLIDQIINLLRRYSPDLKFPFPVYLQSFEYPDFLRIRQIIGYDTDICLIALIEDTGEKIRSALVEETGQNHPHTNCQILEGLNMWNPIWLRIDGAIASNSAGGGGGASGGGSLGSGDGGGGGIGSGSGGAISSVGVGGLGFITSVETCVSKDVGDHWLGYCMHNPAPNPTLICPATTPNWLMENVFILRMAQEICPKPHEKLLPFWTGPQSYDAIVDLTCLADGVGLDYKILTPKIVTQLNDANIALHIWTVNDPVKAKSLLQQYPSITGIFTDEAVLMKGQLAFSKTQPI